MLRQTAILATALTLASCSPAGGGGSSSSSTTGDPIPGGTGSDATTGTGGEDTTFQADGLGGTGQLALFIGAGGLWTESEYPLPAILPSDMANERIRVQVANLGANDLTITGAGLLQLNGDGTSPNKFLKLEWKNIDHTTDFPVTLKPHNTDSTSVLEADLVFAPLAADSNPTTFAVETNDATLGTRMLILRPPAYTPKIRVTPTDGIFWFADLATAETLSFEIHNDGLGLLDVTSVGFSGKPGRFELVDPDVSGSVQPLAATGYTPLVFDVRYQPLFGASLEVASVLVASDSPGEETIEIPLESKYETSPDQSPCVWELPGPGETLDFSETIAGTAARILVLRNVGTQTCTVTSVAAINDPNNLHYVFTGLMPGDVTVEPPEPDVPVSVYPFGVPPGKELRLTVTYMALDAGFDSPLVIDYTDPLPKQLNLDAIGGANKPCLQLEPAVGEEVLTLPFVGGPASGVQRQFVVHSCGEGTLTINSVAIMDDVTPEGPSAFWSVGAPGAGSIKVQPGTSQPYTVLMTLPITESEQLEGTLTVQYTGGAGMEIATIPLTAVVDSTAVLPVANAGSSLDFVDAQVGNALILDGSASLPGPEAVIDPASGYLWMLMLRPAGSAVSVGGAWGASSKIFIPDLPGTFRFGLLVLDDQPHLSNMATVDVIVNIPPVP